MGLARGAAHGAAWNFATVLAERGFGFLVLGLLLRVVPVRVVGLIAIASAISELARVMSLSGAGEQVQACPAIARWRRGRSGRNAWPRSGSWRCCVGSTWVAGLYAQPALTLVLRVMAVNIFLTAFLVVPSARLADEFALSHAGADFPGQHGARRRDGPCLWRFPGGGLRR